MTILDKYKKGLELIAEGQKMLREAQEECDHPKEGLIVVKESNAHYKDPLCALREWEVFDCQICGKHWSTYDE